MHGEVSEALIDVHHRADEVHTNLLSGAGAEDVSPELLAFLQCPRSGALVDRDDELGDGAQDLEELGFCGFHFLLLSKSRADRESATPHIEFSEILEVAVTRVTALSSFAKSFWASIDGTGIVTASKPCLVI